MIHGFVIRCKHFVVVDGGRRLGWKVHFVVVCVIEDGGEQEEGVVVCRFVFLLVVRSAYVHMLLGWVWFVEKVYGNLWIVLYNIVLYLGQLFPWDISTIN